MLKCTLCQAKFEWTLTCEGPLLIADGRYEQPETIGEAEKGKFPNKLFVSHNPTTDFKDRNKLHDPDGLKLRYYVPGTSLRGPFRAQAERIIRSLLPETARPPLTACDPFDMDEKTLGSCSKLLDITQAKVPYAAACPACKLFGCTATASRVQFADADIRPGCRSVYRDMIGIDRFTGGAYPGAKMRTHALENTSFSTSVTVTNFELWQLGLLAYVFRDFADKLVPIGFGKTKGFGIVEGAVTKVTLTYPSSKAEAKIHHLASLAPEEIPHYGLEEVDAPPFSQWAEEAGGLGLYKTFTVANIEALWAAVAPAFNSFITARSKEAAA